MRWTEGTDVDVHTVDVIVQRVIFYALAHAHARKEANFVSTLFELSIKDHF